jgi:uncharacterized protein
VRVHPGSRREEVRRLDDGTLEVWTRARAVEGQANEAVCRLVAAFLGLTPSSVRIVGGARNRVKVVEIEPTP